MKKTFLLSIFCYISFITIAQQLFINTKTGKYCISAIVDVPVMNEDYLFAYADNWFNSFDGIHSKSRSSQKTGSGGYFLGDGYMDITVTVLNNANNYNFRGTVTFYYQIEIEPYKYKLYLTNFYHISENSSYGPSLGNLENVVLSYNSFSNIPDLIGKDGEIIAIIKQQITEKAQTMIDSLRQKVIDSNK